MAKTGQLGLMSSSMPRTTPARTSELGQLGGLRAGPATYTRAPVAVTPAPERHWFSRPGTVDAHEVAPQVSPQACQSGLVAWAVGWPPATRGTRFCRTATTSGVMETSLPQAPTVTDPSAYDDEGGGTGDEGDDGPSLGVVAAPAAFIRKPPLKAATSDAACGGLDRRGVPVRATAGALRARVELRREQAGVHPGDTRRLHAPPGGTERRSRSTAGTPLDRPSGRGPRCPGPPGGGGGERGEGRRGRERLRSSSGPSRGRRRLHDRRRRWVGAARRREPSAVTPPARAARGQGQREHRRGSPDRPSEARDVPPRRCGHRLRGHPAALRAGTRTAGCVGRDQDRERVRRPSDSRQRGGPSRTGRRLRRAPAPAPRCAP